MPIDPLGILPPSLRMNAEREEMIVNQQIASAQSLANELHAMEPGRYEVWLAAENAKPINNIVPGCWHIIRHSDPPAPDYYVPLVTESGRYREPASADKYRLLERDLWNKRDPVPVKKEPKEDREAYIDELAADIRATNRLPGDGGLSRRRWGRG